jgi:transposase
MDYQVEISESGDHLRKLERATKDLKARDRVRFIRLLKIGKAMTQEQAGALIGLQVRQSQRLWKQYREKGLSNLCQNNYVGRKAKLSQAEQEQLRHRLRDDDISTLEQARICLKEEFAVDYTVGGVSSLFQRMRVKLKTGRPSNVKQDKKQMEEFAKKNIHA